MLLVFAKSTNFGNGIDNSASTITVAGNTALTQDADGLSVTADGIGDTQYTSGNIIDLYPIFNGVPSISPDFDVFSFS